MVVLNAVKANDGVFTESFLNRNVLALPVTVTDFKGFNTLRINIHKSNKKVIRVTLDVKHRHWFHDLDQSVVVVRYVNFFEVTIIEVLRVTFTSFQVLNNL